MALLNYHSLTTLSNSSRYTICRPTSHRSNNCKVIMEAQNSFRSKVKISSSQRHHITLTSSKSNQWFVGGVRDIKSITDGLNDILINVYVFKAGVQNK